MSIHDNVFDLMDAMAEQRRHEEMMRQIYAMPDWEKMFLLGYIKYLEAHPELARAAEQEGAA